MSLFFKMLEHAALKFLISFLSSFGWISDHFITSRPSFKILNVLIKIFNHIL
jgi:hypothetical protein